MSSRLRGEGEPFTVRPANESDLEQVNAIYNHYIRETAITFDIEPWTIEARREWFGHYAPSGRHRLLVAVADQVLGYASSSRFRPKAAYETSLETSIYCAPWATGRGIGTALYAALFDALAGEDVHRALAGITMPNDPSLALHRRFGFKKAAYFTEQGRKFGRYWDVLWLEKPLP